MFENLKDNWGKALLGIILFAAGGVGINEMGVPGNAPGMITLSTLFGAMLVGTVLVAHAATNEKF